LKNKKEDLDNTVKEQELQLPHLGFYYGWGMLGGFLVLAIASIGWLSTSESKANRVVAAIVVIALLLVVFIKLSGFGAPTLHIQV
jgi:hypothetical protein